MCACLSPSPSSPLCSQKEGFLFQHSLAVGARAEVPLLRPGLQAALSPGPHVLLVPATSASAPVTVFQPLTSTGLSTVFVLGVEGRPVPPLQQHWHLC